jgi:LysM repeat protein
MTDIKKDSRRKGQTQPWIFERILHRAQPHLTEQNRPIVGPWMIMAAVIVLMIVTAAALFVWTGQMLGSGTASNNPGLSKTLPAGTVPLSTATRAAATPGVVATSSIQTPVAPQATATVAPPPPTATPSVVKYKVKQGDTLLEIALKYGVSVQAIMKANKMKNDVIRIGDELTIPPASP